MYVCMYVCTKQLKSKHFLSGMVVVARDPVYCMISRGV